MYITVAAIIMHHHHHCREPPQYSQQFNIYPEQTARTLILLRRLTPSEAERCTLSVCSTTKVC
jgi:hypothetical protein